MSATATTVPRRFHTQLQPLTISHDPSKSHEGPASSTPKVLTNTSTLPRPIIVAARAYYLEQTPPIGQNSHALQRRRRLIERQEFPRRHSVLPSPGSLATKIASFKVSSPSQNLEVVSKGESNSNVKIEPGEDVAMTEGKQNDIAKATAVATAERVEAVPTPTDFLREIPFQYTHDRLRDWGFAYLGNTATADCFINAVSLRRHSLQLVKEEIAGDQPGQTGMVTIRARILPKTKERKPFVIQRKFDVEELRASIPAVQRPVSTPLRRSHRARRSSAQLSSTKLRRRTRENLGENMWLPGKGAVPIHIEYALHYLPVLAALMLSGHVRKGDSIDLPLPHPESWRDMITYIYTGKGEISAGAKENIFYLAGDAG